MGTHPLHWHKYNCAQTVQRCLIAFTFGKICQLILIPIQCNLSCVYVYIERFFQLAFTIYSFVPLSAKSEVSLWTSENWPCPPTMHGKKNSLSSSSYTWKEEWSSIAVWEEIGYVFPQRIIQGSRSPSGDRCLLAVLSQVWEPQEEVNLRSCHVSAASPRSPLPSLIGFPWNPAFPDAGLDALALNRDIAMEVIGRSRFAILRLSYEIRFYSKLSSLSSMKHLEVYEMWIALGVLNSLAAYSSGQKFCSHVKVIVFFSKLY